MPKQKVIVSERALIQRINRKLAHEHQKLCTSRSWNMEQNCGRYYVLDVYKNAIFDTHVKPETYGRELGVLAEWEALEPAPKGE